MPYDPRKAIDFDTGARTPVALLKTFTPTFTDSEDNIDILKCLFSNLKECTELLGFLWNSMRHGVSIYRNPDLNNLPISTRPIEKELGQFLIIRNSQQFLSRRDYVDGAYQLLHQDLVGPNHNRPLRIHQLTTGINNNSLQMVDFVNQFLGPLRHWNKNLPKGFVKFYNKQARFHTLNSILTHDRITTSIELYLRGEAWKYIETNIFGSYN
jgi:hypothetical protein